MPAPKNIGIRGMAIGMLRLGANQESVAARIGVHKNTISRWWMLYQHDPSKVPEPKKSTGRKEKVTLRNLMRIERSLDCDPFLTARKIRNGVAMNTARILFVCSCSFKS